MKTQATTDLGLFTSKSSSYFWAFKNGGTTWMPVIPKWSMQYFCEMPWIKTESLQLAQIMIASF